MVGVALGWLTGLLLAEEVGLGVGRVTEALGLGCPAGDVAALGLPVGYVGLTLDPGVVGLAVGTAPLGDGDVVRRWPIGVGEGVGVPGLRGGLTVD